MSADDAYMLPRNGVESKRLDIQHAYMQALGHGHLIHPFVGDFKLNKVADVGTGTGVWLREAAHEIIRMERNNEEVELMGFDISSEQFQRESHAKIDFVLHDIVQPFPKRYQETFDLVHVRLLSYAIKARDLKSAVQNIVSLIRPGGFLQWEECDATDCWAIPETPRTRAVIFNVIEERIARGLTPAIVTPLVRTLQSLTISLPQGSFSPLTWTGDLMRIMQLETIPTTNHEAPLVNAMKQDQVMSGAIILNEGAIARRVKSASDISKSTRDLEKLEAEVARMRELVGAIKQGRDPACSDWDHEMTRILARKIVVANRNDEWLNARR